MDITTTTLGSDHDRLFHPGIKTAPHPGLARVNELPDRELMRDGRWLV